MKDSNPTSQTTKNFAHTATERLELRDAAHILRALRRMDITLPDRIARDVTCLSEDLDAEAERLQS